MASPILIEVGMTILALGVLVYFVAGFFRGGGVLEIAVVLAIAGLLLSVVGFAIRRRD